MPDLDFGLSSYERGRGGLTELPVVNYVVEDAPTEERGIILLSRPGNEDLETDLGNGPVDCLFKRDLVLGSALFGVSGGSLYDDGTLIGPLNGDGPFSMAGYEDLLFIAGGEDLWGYDGTTRTIIAFPDGQAVSKVIVAGSRAVCIAKDTGKIYWSDALEGNIDGIDFATAENQPDRLLDMLFLDGILVLFGAETVELWPLGTDSDAPFTPIQARVIERGIRATGCATAIGSTFAWITNNSEVCLSDENNVISNPGLQKRIAESATARLWSFLLDGVEYLALRLDSETQVWSMRSKLWGQFTSRNETNWVPQCFAGGVFGSAIDGRTLQWSDAFLDLGLTLERRFRAGFWGEQGTIVDNLHLRCEVGTTPHLEGDYLEPMIEMRQSRDNGQSWGDWRSRSLGRQGEYHVTPTWNALGMLKRNKAFLAEFRVTAPVSVRISAVKANEPIGGR
jgi:hypothetical protein